MWSLPVALLTCALSFPGPAASAAADAPTSQAGRARSDQVAPQRKSEAPEPPLDIAQLEKRLKETEAIGFFTKLTLKNEVDDLLARFREYHGGQGDATPAELRRPYETLILKVLSLLQDSDPRLAADIASSREALWGILIDRKKFANL